MTLFHVLPEVISPIKELVTSFHRAGMRQRGDMFCPKVTEKFMLSVERARVVAAFPLAFERRSDTRVGD
jgi:hypothetical protein